MRPSIAAFVLALMGPCIPLPAAASEAPPDRAAYVSGYVAERQARHELDARAVRFVPTWTEAAERIWARWDADYDRHIASTAPAPAVAYYPGDSIWDALAMCESGGDPTTNTGNGYFGAFQFSLTTWLSVGGTGFPHEHPYEVQLHFAKILQARSGWGQWPMCASKLGLR